MISSSSVGQPSAAMLLGMFEPPKAQEQMTSGLRPSNDVRYWREQLQADVFDFRWLDENTSRSPTLRLLRWIARRTGRWSEVLAVATARRVRRYDVVYVTGEEIGLVAGACARIIPGRKPYFINRVERSHAGHTPFRRFIYRTVLAFASKSMSVMICRSAPVRQSFERRSRIPASRFLVFGQEVDTQFFSSSCVENDIKPPADVPYLVSAGLEHRDYATLLDAVDGLPISVVIAAGSPWSKDRFEVGRELPPNTAVRAFDHVEMRSLYASAAVVVVSVRPTDRSCGISVIGEAWAMGRPVIATLTEGLAEHLIDRQNCIAVPPGDVRAMRAAIEEVLGSPMLAAKLGETGREYVTGTLSLAHYRKAVEHALRLGGLATNPTTGPISILEHAHRTEGA